MKPAALIAIAALIALGGCSSGTSADREIIGRVAAWQVEHHGECRHALADWTNGALYHGLFEWAEYTDDENLFTFLADVGERTGWGLQERVYHADDLCAGWLYASMYDRFRDPRMVAPLKERVDWIVAHPLDQELLITIPGGTDRWSWCDALFMAPPVFAKMYRLFGDGRYLSFMDREFRETTDSLYNPAEGLYYRDCTYLDRQEKNGKDVFWGRGNGWVFAGLARLLETLPEDHATYPWYRDIFREMAAAAVRCQDADGSWHASMLDPEAYPIAENSASGFFTYGLAWGWNHGVLTDPAFRKAAEKGWKALKGYVHPDGFLGNVQPIGAEPGQTGPDMTEVYGVGAFLLAGTQIIQMK